MKQFIYKNGKSLHFLALFCVFFVSFAYFLQFSCFLHNQVIANFDSFYIRQESDNKTHLSSFNKTNRAINKDKSLMKMSPFRVELKKVIDDSYDRKIGKGLFEKHYSII